MKTLIISNCWFWETGCRIAWGSVADWLLILSTFGGLFGAYLLGLSQARMQRKMARIDMVEAVGTIAEAAAEMSKFVAKDLSDRERHYNYAMRLAYFDHQLIPLHIAHVKEIPIHELPTTKIIKAVMALSSNLHQLNYNVEESFKGMRNMDADAYTNFFTTLKNITDSLWEIAIEIQHELKELKSHD